MSCCQQQRPSLEQNLPQCASPWRPYIRRDRIPDPPPRAKKPETGPPTATMDAWYTVDFFEGRMGWAVPLVAIFNGQKPMACERNQVDSLAGAGLNSRPWLKLHANHSLGD